jgi:hypothetical protein
VLKIFHTFLLLAFFWSSHVLAQPKENRVALVVGNSAYKSAPLRNPTNDAKDMATKLKGMGFTVIERNNLTVKQIGSTLREFRSKLTPGSVALVFYAGHGLQIKGENYLPAVDADIGGEEDVPTQSLAMRQIMDVLEDAKTRLNLVFLDACRNNPYARSFRSASDGLNRINAPSGTLISFATRPGSVAADGTGRNGLYTGALLEQMNNQSQPIELVLKRVVSQVKSASNSQQEPWMEGSIDGDFCFGNCNQSNQRALSDDDVHWGTIKDSKDVNDYVSYLRKFPSGFFADIAKNRINALRNLTAPVNPTPSAGLESPQKKPVAIRKEDTNPASTVQMESNSRNLVDQYFSTWSLNDDAAEEFLNRYLSDKVSFYGGEMKKSEIMLQKTKFMKRWPSRKYKERMLSTSVSCNSDRKTCLIKGVVDWSVASSPRNAKSSGVSEFELGIDYSLGEVRITQENGRTLDRSN